MKQQRSVPLTTKICITFGGALNGIGWAFFGIGMLITILMVPMVDLSFVTFSGTLEQSRAKVSNVLETNASVNDRIVMEIHYEFSLEDKSQHSGFSFSHQRIPSMGSTVDIEFPKGDPTHSRIVGMRHKPMPPFVLFVLIFPTIGICLLLFGFRKAKKVLTLLAQGTLTHGQLVKKEPTNTRINEQMVYKLTFEFKDQIGETHLVSEKTHQTHLLEDDENEPLLYLEHAPTIATLLDALPSAPKFDQQGRIIPASSAKAAMTLIIPLIVMVALGFFS